MTRNAFYETPPFSRIVAVNWEEEGFSAIWLLKQKLRIYAQPVSEFSCFPPVAPFVPNHTALYGPGTYCTWGFVEVHLFGQSEGLVVSGAPTGFENTLPEKIILNIETPPGTTSISVVGESLDLTMQGWDMTPYACYGTGSPDDPPLDSARCQQSHDPLYGIDSGTIQASGISGTIDGAPAIKIRTEISASKGGDASVTVTFERGTP